jgi:CRP-like cAMP-binding protein
MKFLEMFRDWKDTVEYAPQAVIYTEGEPANVLFVVLSGEIELTMRGESLGTENAGGIVGEMALLDSASRSTTAKSLSDAKLARVNRDELARLSRLSPEFSMHVMATLAKRLRSVDRFISAQISGQPK